jgi:hypothetical protein
MISSGIRLAAWDDLKVKHVQPIYKDEKLVAGKLIVYPNSNETYITFITPEAFSAIIEWVEYRKQSGEVITQES